jgi:hypothetical protein
VIAARAAFVRQRRSLSVRAGVLALRESLLVNRDIHRQALISTEFRTPAERGLALHALEQDRVEVENAIEVLRAHEARQ